MNSDKPVIQSMIENSVVNLDVNCNFVLKGSSSYCGFQIKCSDFVDGGISISTENKIIHTLNISGIVKVKVYEMQMTAYSEKRPLVISSVSIAGSAAGMTPMISNLSADAVINNCDDTYLLLKCQMGTKKSALSDYP